MFESSFNMTIKKIKQICSVVILGVFFSTSIIPTQYLHAAENLAMVAPGTLVQQSEASNPIMLKGININPNEPFTFDFLVDTNGVELSEEEFALESEKLIKYFLTSLTVPEEQMWVNLSPYEENRIVPELFGKTEMGRDLLVQDYMLKQMTASLMYPEKELGQKFWKRVKSMAKEQYGTNEIPMKTFNKVWIVPKEARVFEHARGAVVVDSYLNVMLEEDYLALEANANRVDHGLGDVTVDELVSKQDVSTQVIREIIIPEIEKEVNSGAVFANLRQIYNSMILAVWYKRALKESMLGEVYMDQGRVKGVEQARQSDNQKIYEQYVQAFKVGVYNYIKEDLDPQTNQVVPRQYFSGGAVPMTDQALLVEKRSASDIVADLESSQVRMVKTRMSRISVPTQDYAVKAQDQTLQTFLDEIRASDNQAFTDVSLEAAISELDGEAEGALGKGGLGFLTGDTWGAYQHLSNYKGMGVMPLYERHYNDGSAPIDWDNQPGIRPFKLDGSGETLTFNVDFNLGTFPVQIYWINRNGMPVFLIRSPQFFERLYPGGTVQIQQYGFLARAYVELMKQLEVSPSIVRLSEGQLVFVGTAMQNDVKHYESVEDKSSVFENSKIVFTTHTPEQAALPKFNNLDELQNLIGRDLFEGIIKNGRVDAARALAEMADIINGVSEEHGEVTKIAVLPEFADKTTAIQNGNEEATWYTPQLRDKVGKVGLANVTGKDLFDIGTEVKLNDLQKLLQDSFDVQFADPSRPLIGLVRRLVAYKEQRIFIPLIRWIVGDPNTEYFNDDTGESLGKGLGANLLIGGHALDDVSPDWVRQFKQLMQEPDIKGKFLYVSGTGIELRKLAVAASDVWVSIPRATREASGTSDGAAALNGTVNIATATGGPLSYIKHRQNGWLIDVFKDRPINEVVLGFDQLNQGIIQEFKDEGGRQLAQYLRETVAQYNDYVSRGNTKWLSTMLSSFTASHQEVSIEVMIRKYGLLFESVLDGSGVAGFQQRMQRFDFVPDGIKSDKAVLSDKVGGIDLNSATMNMTIDRDGQGLILPEWKDVVYNKDIIGLRPMILNVSPVVNLPMILGIKQMGN